MLSMLFIFMAASTLSWILLMITQSVSSTPQHSREKSSPFECGFDPMNSARVPFSLRFFLLAVLFLIFDIEIAIIIPMPFISMCSDITQFIMTINIFLIILTLGLLHEWNEGSLEWSK
uniref:NADH-ubiquinone oxidoreductase chain 3 n=1 Tax=Ramisyllis multicaudata TaxID=1166726 RepID=A0A0K0YD51_RAMMU|nr:NADH dehydrogenase subunit 3 [Ramisyllis multicaudata]AKS48912.1 NADH dehydrogenase subunit 3 [Ramisyllis multicaudata]